MFTKKCFCGERTKNFKVDIGPGYMDNCCKSKGYNVKGELEGKPQNDEPEAVVEESKEAQEDMQQAAEITNEEAQDAKKEPDFEGMTAKALMEYCKQKDIRFSKKDTRKKLLERIEEASK